MGRLPSERLQWSVLAALLGTVGCGAEQPSSDAGPVDAASSEDAADANEPFVLGCESAACSLTTNGCDAGNACYYLPSRVNAPPQPRCRAAGDNAAGSICNDQEQCAPGLGCDPTNRCRQYCCAPGERTGCPANEACLLEFRDSNDQSLGVGICQQCDASDPITSVGCGANEACYPAGNDGSCVLCAPPRTNGRPGSACSTSSDCRPGLGCRQTNPPQCATFCSVQASSGCGTGEACTAVGYTGLPDLGFCVTP
jgi:hypothetical protein